MTLEELYGELARTVPVNADDQERAAIFDRDSVPCPPEELETDAISVHVGRHQYSDSLVAERAVVFAKPDAYRLLGLLCLGVLLHPGRDAVDLHLSSQISQVRVIRIRYESPVRNRHPPPDSPYEVAYNVMPHALQYWINPDRDLRLAFPEGRRPHLELTTPGENWDQVHAAEKTHLVAFTGDQAGHGLANLAELLLDLGSPQHNSQFNLEVDGGRGWEGGVEFSSAELRLYLPGHPGFADPGPRDTVQVWPS